MVGATVVSPSRHIYVTCVDMFKKHTYTSAYNYMPSQPGRASVGAPYVQFVSVSVLLPEVAVSLSKQNFSWIVTALLAIQIICRQRKACMTRGGGMWGGLHFHVLYQSFLWYLGCRGLESTPRRGVGAIGALKLRG